MTVPRPESGSRYMVYCPESEASAVAVFWAILFFVTYLPLLSSLSRSVSQRLREEA